MDYQCSNAYIISDTWYCKVLCILYSKGCQLPKRCLADKCQIMTRFIFQPNLTNKWIFRQWADRHHSCTWMCSTFRELHTYWRLTIRRETYGWELHFLAQPTSLSRSSASLTALLSFCSKYTSDLVINSHRPIAGTLKQLLNSIKLVHVPKFCRYGI